MEILDRMGGIGRAFSNRMADIAANRMDELGMGAPPQEVYPIASVMSQRSMGPLPGSLDWQLSPPEMSQKPGSGHAEALHMVGTGSMGGPRGAGLLEGAFAETPVGRQIAANRNIADAKMFAEGMGGTWEEAWQRGLNEYAQSGDWMSAYGMGT